MENRVGEYEQGQHVSTPQETILHVAPEQMEPTLIDSSGGDPTILNHERSGKELWKKAAFKIRHARMFVEAAQASWEPGKSQGIDAHTMQYDALSCQCQITAVDYGVERCKIINTLDNASLDGYLNRKVGYPRSALPNLPFSALLGPLCAGSTSAVCHGTLSKRSQSNTSCILLLSKTVFTFLNEPSSIHT